NDAYSVNEDATLNVSAPGVLANDSDADGNALTAAVVSGPSNGVLNLNANGSFTYRPNTNFNGTDSFTYRASDGTANSGTASVTITVNAVPPSFTNAPPTVSIISPTNGAVFVAPQNVSVVADASDADGTVTNVTFFQASTRLGATKTPPYYVVWTNAGAG